MGLAGIVTYGAGLVVSCVPGATVAGEAIVKAGGDLLDSRRSFARSAAAGLKRLETALPALIVANSALCVSANSSEGIEYHGPLDASVAFNNSTIVYTVPGVGTDEYAEARITFPTSWISGCEVTSGSELPTILTEEQQWADEANAKREAARMAIIVSLIAAAAAVALSILFIIRIKKNYQRTHTPLFQDKYFRDVPTADHPAVLGALHRDGKADVDDFTATLMQRFSGGEKKAGQRILYR